MAAMAIWMLILAPYLQAKSMDNTIDEVLKIKDDDELCSKVYDHLIKHYGEKLDASKMAEKHRPALLTFHAMGIIDNGGFQYLFEGDFKGDPVFALTLTAFKNIKAEKCAEAFAEALRLFPDSRPPTDIEKRLKVYQSHPMERRNAIDMKFFKGSKEVPKLLAKYIRENAAEFRKLK
jgi:hypothetical protein